ncbi:tigger transposable element-derived protein 4-like [Rhagoletis pomonella]|uniref:tigger transposable element-derived protein 4-like n=1 Tax=Rhagoletis pomonella TaxID=28610 RepID=UPI001783878E|nr:tigger transposable element-derived protein 4-like [Rhagoletis pomonella]
MCWWQKKQGKNNCHGLQYLEVDYENNSKSWMTSELYEKWLLKLDKKFAAQKRKILLFIDNCPAHPKSAQSKLTNIKTVYFPPNMTSSLQPMDQGIIQNLKHHYRKRILKKVLCYSEKEAPMSISLLDAIRDLSKAWSSDVKKDTISNCFKKAGFDEGIELPVDIEDENLPLADLWSAYVEDNNIEDVTIEDYINVNNETFTMECPSDEDILQSILSNQYGLNNSENDDSDADEEENELPTFSQLHSFSTQ